MAETKKQSSEVNTSDDLKQDNAAQQAAADKTIEAKLVDLKEAKQKMAMASEDFEKRKAAAKKRGEKALAKQQAAIDKKAADDKAKAAAKAKKEVEKEEKEAEAERKKAEAEYLQERQAVIDKVEVGEGEVVVEFFKSPAGKFKLPFAVGSFASVEKKQAKEIEAFGYGDIVEQTK